MNEELLIRLSLMHTVFSFYKPNELSKNGDKLRRRVRKAFKKVADKDIETAKSIIKQVDKAWVAVLDKYKNKQFVASNFIVALWTEKMEKYGITDKLMEKYSASEVTSHASLELMTYKIVDEIIEGIKDEKI